MSWMWVSYVGLAVSGLAAGALCLAEVRSRASDESGDRDSRDGAVTSNVIPLVSYRKRLHC